MYEPSEAHAARPTDAARRTREAVARLRQMAAAQPWIAAAFLAGVLVGWVGLGWWLLPIQWRNASPAVLSGDWQTQYVQLVAASLARSPSDKTTAKELLAALERTPDELARILAEAEARSLDPGRTADVHSLAVEVTGTVNSSLGLPTSSTTSSLTGASNSLAAPASSANATGAATDANMQRDALWLVGLAMAGLLGLLLIRRISPSHEPAEAAVSGTTGPLIVGQGMDGSTRGLALGRRRSPALQSWRLDVGDSVTTECDLSERFYQTWLLYDEQGGLVGSAGVQDKPIGQVGTLVVWLRAQFDDDDRLAPPQLYIVSESAYLDTMLRERLSDENSQVIPAEAGRVASLNAGQLALDVEVRGVRPSDGPTPRAVAVRMGLRRVGAPATAILVAPTVDAEPPPRYRQD